MKTELFTEFNLKCFRGTVGQTGSFNIMHDHYRVSQTILINKNMILIDQMFK